MKYRKVRIAWSVASGVVFVLLCVLWVRSYWRFSTVFVPWPYLRIEVVSGLVWAGNPGGRFQVTEFQVMSGDTRDLLKWQVLPRTTSREAFHFYHVVMAPFWFLAVIAGVMSGMPWLGLLRYRFSLRTLLVVMTLIAVVLGVVVWAVR